MVKKILIFTIGLGGLTYLAVRVYKDQKARQIDARTVSASEAKEIILMSKMQAGN